MSPELSIVVASRGRPIRLRWLLNALDAQTLDAAAWEVIVCHGAADLDVAALLRSHPLARRGVLRAAGGAGRTAAIRLARAPTIVFTEEDCRPPEDWLANLLTAARRHPAAIIQGPVEADPDEWAMWSSPYPLTVAVQRVPTPWAEGCNIVYPRELLEQVGGFAEDHGACEDTELALRVRAAGAPHLGDHAMLTYHAVEDASVCRWIRASARWKELPWLIRCHPELRSELRLGVFWKREHMWVLVAVLGLSGIRRHRMGALLALPWAVGRGAHGRDLRGHLRDTLELPGWAIIDLAEVLMLIRSSIQHRTLVL